MATKKQKREASAAKRVKWLHDRRVSGLQAQKDDHKDRKNKLREAWREKHNKNHDWKTIDKNCILCLDQTNTSIGNT